MWKTFALRYFLVPIYVHGVWEGIKLFSIAEIISSLYLANTFVVNHIQEGLVPEDNEAHWAVKQVQGSANWSSGSYWANVASGGLNHQIEHHLFPHLSSARYPVISPAVKAACEAHGLEYRTFVHYPSAWWGFIQTLLKYGNEENLHACEEQKNRERIVAETETEDEEARKKTR